jgi:hypothetical protein
MKKVRLTHQQARVIDYLQVHPTISSDKAQAICGSGTYKQSANLLLRMEKEKLLKKISRGLYELGTKQVGAQKEFKFKIKNVEPKKQEEFTFKVDDNWKPKKITLTDKYTMALVDAVKGLAKGQSIQLSVAELKKQLNTDATSSLVNSIRHRLKKHISPHYFGNYRIFVEKDNDQKMFAIRIMYYYGV